MKEDGEINFLGMAIFFGFPLLIIIAMCVVSMGGKEGPNAAAVAAAEREKRKSQESKKNKWKFINKTLI